MGIREYNCVIHVSLTMHLGIVIVLGKFQVPVERVELCDQQFSKGKDDAYRISVGPPCGVEPG